VHHIACIEGVVEEGEDDTGEEMVECSADCKRDTNGKG
jgi:hypothetical protein